MNNAGHDGSNLRAGRERRVRPAWPGLLLATSLTLASCSVSFLPAPETTTDDTTGSTGYAPGGTLSTGYVAPSGQWTGGGQSGPWCARTASTPATTTTTDAAATQLLDLATGARGVAQDWTDRVPGQLRVYRGAALRTQNLEAQHVEQLAALGLRTVEADPSGWALLEGDDTRLRDAAEALVAGGTVQYVQPEYVYRPAGLPAPNDRDYLRHQSSGLSQSGFEPAWAAIEAGCDPVVVAVIDSGVPLVGGWDDLELQPNFVPRSAWYNVATNTRGNAEPYTATSDPAYWHGTAVSSVLAMVTYDRSGGAGVTYNQAKVLPIGAMIEVIDSSTNKPVRTFTSGSLAEAIDYALGGVNGTSNPYPARILNFSLGSSAASGDDEYLRKHFDKVASNSAISVVATGNENRDVTSLQSQNMWTIGVGATDLQKNRGVWTVDPAYPSGSNYGNGLDFMAIGTNVYARANKVPGRWTGTSLAAPMVSGQVALWMYANQHHSGSATNGHSGRSVFNAAMRCLAAASATGADWNPLLHAWESGTGWQPETGAGLVDTTRLVDSQFLDCR